MEKIFKIILIFLSSSFLYAYDNNIASSQSNLAENYINIKKHQANLVFQTDFNKGVLSLSKGDYPKAISIFKRTQSVLKAQSWLNIGVAYYKMDAIAKASVYFNRVYNKPSFRKNNTYSFFSSCYYLYKISNDKKYLATIINTSTMIGKLSQYSKEVLVDSLIILKKYRSALKVLKTIRFSTSLKKALLCIKLKDYKKAKLYLIRAKTETNSSKKINEIVWFTMFVNLKLNNFEDLNNNLNEIEKTKKIFKANLTLPLEMFFNENKYSRKEHLDFVQNLSFDRKINFIYYFAPFIFSDNQEIIYDLTKGFLYDKNNNLVDLDKMIDYNEKFLEYSILDPIERVLKMRSLLGVSKKSYNYYNLALAYAQNYDFDKAYLYFNKAYKSNPGNKLYAAMLLITAKRLDRKISSEKYIVKNLLSNVGLYNYFGKELYKMFIKEDFNYSYKGINYSKTIFYKVIEFLKAMKTKTTLSTSLMNEKIKDPMVYLIGLIQRFPEENDFKYYSRIQDSLPLNPGEKFIGKSLFVTNYYIDVLQAIGLFSKANFRFYGKTSPSYFFSKALYNLYFGSADEAIKIYEFLQKEYKMNDRQTMYYLVAALLKAQRYNDASIQISLIKSFNGDSKADFLSGIQLIQEMKINSAKTYFKKPFYDPLIDFRIKGFDEYLESI